jgi:metal-responsive CopG/Arc/MetJ family transcriptional regulator
MKTAISLPDGLFEEGERAAQQLGMSRSELYATALEAYLKAHRAEHITAQLDELYQEEAPALDEVTQQLQVLSLPQEEW